MYVEITVNYYFSKRDRTVDNQATRVHKVEVVLAFIFIDYCTIVEGGSVKRALHFGEGNYRKMAFRGVDYLLCLTGLSFVTIEGEFYVSKNVILVILALLTLRARVERANLNKCPLLCYFSVATDPKSL